jgi:VanZ family protein
MQIPHARLTLSILAVSAILAAFHWYASLNFLYWHYVWLDTLSHFLGGVLAGLMSIRFLRGVRLPSRFVFVFLLVLLVGVAWETFEFFIGSPREANYVFDTSVDIVMDMLGGALAYLLFGRTVHKA